MKPHSLKKYIRLSIAAALLTILLKGVAWYVTDSVSLLSDALESFVNLAGALMALAMISIAEQPADDEHPYGHGKAEYFSSGFEGLLIFLAAIAIGVAAIERLRNPQPLLQIDLGIAVSVAASLINFVTARLLLSAGKKYRSVTLQANAHHLMTDVWTSAGVIAGIFAVSLTQWHWLDPAMALFVAANIIWTGWKLLRQSAYGLMDVALPAEDHAQIVAILEKTRADGMDYHALRSRESGVRRFVEFHLLIPGQWSISRGHALAEQIEAEIRHALPGTTVLTHIEPINDPISHADISLDR